MRHDWSYTFIAAKDDKAGLMIQGRPYFDRVVSTLAAGELVVMKLEPWVEKRTNAQNRGMWGVTYDSLIAGLVTAGHYEPHERAQMKALIHEGLCAQYQGYVMCPVTKQQVRKFRTSKATKQEFSDFIEWVARFAAKEYGVVVELPGEAA